MVTVEQRPSLYERLGGEAGIRAITDAMVDAHLRNPLIGVRFLKSDIELGKQHAFEFVASGSGGPQVYTGQELTKAHAGMNLNEQELVAVIDDTLAVMREQGVGMDEQNEVLGILFSLKDQVLHI